MDSEHPAWSEPSGGDPEAFAEGGDPVCWAHLVCPECGAIPDDRGAERCERCGAQLPAEDH